MLPPGMLARAAVVVPVVASLAAVGATLVLTRSKPAPPAPPPPVIAVKPAPPPPPPPPHPYLRPVGGQYLEVWGEKLTKTDGAPPHLFLLDAKQLASHRYGWQVDRIARSISDELAAVLEEGCKGPCPDEVAHAQEILRDEDFNFGNPKVLHWITGEDVHEEHSQFSTADAHLTVTCRCDTWTIGMQLWNDIAECQVELRDHKKRLLTYKPTTERGSGKMELFTPLEAWTQTVELASGAVLEIDSGYKYTGDDAYTPRVRAEPRGALQWTTP